MATAVSNAAGRHSLSQILKEFVKFAVGSAIDGSLKIIPGGRKQVDKMVPEGLINMPMPTVLKTNKHLDKKVANELHFDAKMEEVKEEMNNIKQQYKTSTKLAEESQQPPNKMDDDGFKGINLVQKNGRRVFIRSRL
ncbi:uncharacterized protein LOC123897084 [Trifolium pratense]|uniref:Uncharacterized protein n=1 Tax=Trifolium pratense TaxID=57577 RepID=A0ACB0KJD6_TRIPR|nr:uncharacterized protein LOC123897084 [Trifolium pratense]CAJ2656900.1 unnamed protein product [Trifolium pratense]